MLPLSASRLRFPSVPEAAEVTSTRHSLVMPLTMPEPAAGATAQLAAQQAPASFVEALSRCVSNERHTKSWCAAAKWYQRLQPHVLCRGHRGHEA